MSEWLEAANERREIRQSKPKEKASNGAKKKKAKDYSYSVTHSFLFFNRKLKRSVRGFVHLADAKSFFYKSTQTYKEVELVELKSGKVLISYINGEG